MTCKGNSCHCIRLWAYYLAFDFHNEIQTLFTISTTTSLVQANIIPQMGLLSASSLASFFQHLPLTTTAKHKSDIVTPWLKTLQWLPIESGMKFSVFFMVSCLSLRSYILSLLFSLWSPPTLSFILWSPLTIPELVLISGHLALPLLHKFTKFLFKTCLFFSSFTKW